MGKKAGSKTIMIDKQNRNQKNNHNSFLIWLTGLPCSGKTTLASSLEELLFEKGYQTVLLDGDIIRNALNKDLSFSKQDRDENLRRIAEISRLFIRSGLIVIASFVSPYKEQREAVSRIVSKKDFFEIYIDTPLDECIKRDVKGMYAKAIKGVIKNFTGISDPYEAPLDPFLRVDTLNCSPKEATNLIFDSLKDNLTYEQLN